MKYYEKYISSGRGEIALSIWDTGRQNPCIVFLPATMGYPGYWVDFLARLAESDVNVIGVHFISHGKSSREIKKYSFEDMVVNSRDAITYTLKNFNERIGILGTSQGGILAAAVAGMDNRVKAVFCHNVMLPQLKESIKITTFPLWSYNIAKALMGFGAKVLPALQIPIQFYLDLDKIFLGDEWKVKFFNDPLNLKKYPVYFLNSLFTADLNMLTDGSVKCPVIIFASKGDRLFTPDYTKKVFEMIKAENKELVVFDTNAHLIFNEALEVVFDTVVDRIRHYLS